MRTALKGAGWRRREHITSWMFILPALSLFVLFMLIPMLKGIYVSLFKDTLGGSTFVGLDNYRKLFTMDVYKFWTSMKNTLVIVIFTVPSVVLFALFVSVNIYRRSSGVRSFIRAAFYLPTVSSVVSIALVWNWIFHPGYGILNYLLGNEGTAVVAWLSDKQYAMPLLIMVLITISVGQPIIIYIAALGNIPSTYLEAASIDGASGWKQFRFITWPLLMPTTLYIVITSMINAFSCFSLVKLLTGGGPYYSTTTLMYQVYDYGFAYAEYGMSAAMGVILAITILICSVIQYKYLSSDVEY